MKLQALALACCTMSIAQVTIPDGTKLRVRLDQPVSSATAEVGQTVEFTVAEPILINSVTAIKEGARVTGTVTEAVPKRRLGRAGKLDFSIDRAMAVDGRWIPLRYSLQKKAGNSHAVRTGIITAGVAFAFWPAAPVVLLMKGKDVNVNRGVTFDVFTDTAHALASDPSEPTAPAVKSASPSPAAVPTSSPAAVSVTSSVAGAETELNGAFAGSTPTTLQLPAGSHQIVVKSGTQSWVRTLQVMAGSTVSLHAVFDQPAPVTRARQ